MYIHIISTLFFILTFVSCNQLGLSKKDDNNSQRNLLLGAVIAQQSVGTSAINFKAIAGTQGEVGCSQKIMGHKHISESVNLYIKDLRFYVHDIYVKDFSGNKQSVTPIPDGKFQSNSLVLLDFEDGTGDCSGGTTEMNKSIKANIIGTNFASIGFTIGVPESSNFLDNTSQSAPLNVNAMYWNWKSGYKFFKFDFVTKDGTNISSSFHLGSGSCNGATNTTPSTSCTYANRPTIELKKSDGSAINLSRDVVYLDLKNLLNGTNTSSSAGGTSFSCMAGNTNATCKSLLNNIGINEATGGNYSTQTSFSVGANSN
jgi:uncharacterized repeat protein (TIGR04052 family)